MALFCEYGCRVRDRKGCPKHPMAQVERVLPLDGFMWCGESDERPFDRGREREGAE